MKWLHDLSIRNKLVGVIVFSTISFLAIGFAIDVFLDIRAFRRELIEQTTALARVTAEHSVAELAFLDVDAANETLSKLRIVPSVEAAYLHDIEGDLFAVYRRSEEVPETVDPGSNEAGVHGVYLRVTEPVIWEGENYGTLTVLASTVALREKVYGYLTTMGVILLVLLGGSLFVALRLEKVISKPILRLASTAREVSEHHDYSIRFPRETDDEIGQLAGSFNDMLTQIERRQKERDEANQRTREKSQFLANMSHELRTPLNAIIGFSEILRGRLDERLSDKEVSFLENINVSGHHLLSLVNDILDLSKIEAGKLEINPEMTNVEEAITSICNLMRGVSSKRGVDLLVDVPPDVPHIEADPGKLKQILYNLLSNAVKFSSDDARVWLSARRIEAAESRLGETSVAISVRDEGVGIDPEDHELIFREFQQLDSSLGRKFGGTGLGLALVRKFTDAHGGIVDVESALGEGSKFTITLPVVFRGAITDVDHISEFVADEEEREIVVVIEEDAQAYLGWKRQLLEGGYRPVWARNGQEGVAVAQRLRASAVVIDPLIHEVDVWHVISALLSSTDSRNVPIIVATWDRRSHRDIVIDSDAWTMRSGESIRRAIEAASGGARLDEGCVVYGEDPAFVRAAKEVLESLDVRAEITPDAERALARLNGSRTVLVQIDAKQFEGLELIHRAKASLEPATVVSVLPIQSSEADLKEVAHVVERLAPTEQSLSDVVKRRIGASARSEKGQET